MAHVASEMQLPMLCALLLFIMSQKDFISIYYFNATSIRGAEKLSSFNASFSGKCYDVVSLTETWLHDGVHDKEILPNCDYDIYRRDRSSDTSTKEDGGGVMLCVNKKYSSYRRFDLESVAEILWVQLTLENNCKAFIGTIYLPIQNEAVLQQV